MQYTYHFLTLIKDLLFPIFCLGCKKEGTWLCDDCKPTVDCSGLFLCSDCDHPSLSSHAAMMKYEEHGISGGLIRAWKYNNSQEVGQILRFYLAKFIAKEASWFFRADFVVPVPLHRRRYAERGFNQAELLAKDIAKIFDWPCIPALKRTCFTSQQARLNREAREKNVKNSFQVTTSFPAGASVLLVDDVYTTGVTLQECARVLRRAGVKEVHGFTLARGISNTVRNS